MLEGGQRAPVIRIETRHEHIGDVRQPQRSPFIKPDFQRLRRQRRIDEDASTVDVEQRGRRVTGSNDTLFAAKRVGGEGTDGDDAVSTGHGAQAYVGSGLP